MTSSLGYTPHSGVRLMCWRGNTTYKAIVFVASAVVAEPSLVGVVRLTSHWTRLLHRCLQYNSDHNDRLFWSQEPGYSTTSDVHLYCHDFESDFHNFTTHASYSQVWKKGQKLQVTLNTIFSKLRPAFVFYLHSFFQVHVWWNNWYIFGLFVV